MTESADRGKRDAERLAVAERIMQRAQSWFDIQGVACAGELSAKAKSIRDDMRRWLANRSS